MTDTQNTPAPKVVPETVREIFAQVVTEQHPALEKARMPVRFAEKKQSEAVKLERITKPEVRAEANCDGVLVICPDWFRQHNPAQVRMGVDDPNADLYREIDIALCAAAPSEKAGDGLKVQHPELPGVFKAEALRYGVEPGTEAAEVVEVLVRRAEMGLEYGEALPSKHDPVPPEQEQEALPVQDGDGGASDGADGDSEGGGEVVPPEDTEDAPEPSSVSQIPGAIDPNDPWAKVGEAEESG